MKNSLVYYLTVFVLIISSGSSFSQKCPDGMISYWKLDELGGVTTFIDSYGGFNASCTPSTRPVQGNGIVSQARNFDSTSLVTVPHYSNFDWADSASFSIEVWIKTSLPGTGNKVFVGKPAAGSSKMSWWLGYGADNKAIFSVRDSSGVRTQIEGIKVINNGNWHHIVGIRNDSMNVLQLFVDKVQENIETTFFTGDFSGSSPVYLGAYGSSFHFSGLLDEIAIYSKALNQSEITAHYNAGMQSKGYCDQFTSVEDGDEIPRNFSLHQNYPNPFNPETNIKADIPRSGNITLTVYNVMGEKVKDLFHGFVQPGVYNFLFDGKDLTSGIYFYKLQTDNFTQVKKMILLK